MSFLSRQKILKFRDISAGMSIMEPAHIQPIGIDRRFEKLVSPDEWAALPEAVRQRFLKKLSPGESALYRGQIMSTSMSPLGWALAQLARFIGAPLPIDPASKNNAAMVGVSDDARSGGQIWTRIYCRRDGFPQTINSVKRFEGPTGLEEHVGAGIGMALSVSVLKGALLFQADHYFVKFFGSKIRLPRWMSPGDMVIAHHDLGAEGRPGQFVFSLDLQHKVFGPLIQQSVLFTDMEETCHG